ncbi:biotin-requiring enzyme family protein [Mycobacterium xenopi 3993]|nr:biotin-requiring enzyme family protein [Mycobacterium xenopi 3993]
MTPPKQTAGSPRLRRRRRPRRRPSRKQRPSRTRAADRHGPAGDGGQGATTPVLMPELGESVTEGTVTRWLKKVGDSVQVDEPLVEVSTDKVDTEIPSPVAGTLVSITAEEDTTVPVGGELAKIGTAAAPG